VVDRGRDGPSHREIARARETERDKRETVSVCAKERERSEREASERE
jgi:hypothetical protein